MWSPRGVTFGATPLWGNIWGFRGHGTTAGSCIHTASTRVSHPHPYPHYPRRYPHLLAAASSSPVLASILTPVVAGLLAAASSSSVLASILTPVLTGILTGILTSLPPSSVLASILTGMLLAPPRRRRRVVVVASSSHRRLLAPGSARDRGCDACRECQGAGGLPGITAYTTPPWHLRRPRSPPHRRRWNRGLEPATAPHQHPDMHGICGSPRRVVVAASSSPHRRRHVAACRRHRCRIVVRADVAAVMPSRRPSLPPSSVPASSRRRRIVASSPSSPVGARRGGSPPPSWHLYSRRRRRRLYPCFGPPRPPVVGPPSSPLLSPRPVPAHLPAVVIVASSSSPSETSWFGPCRCPQFQPCSPASVVVGSSSVGIVGRRRHRQLLPQQPHASP